MEIEKLIELVKDKPVLYNKNHRSYRKNEIKMEIWRGIGKELDISGEKCKYKWKGLRTQYVREKEMRNVPSGSATVKKKEWKYFEMMTFLEDFLEPRATHKNIFETVNLFELDDTIEKLEVDETFTEIYNNSSGLKRSSKSRGGSEGCDTVKGFLENFFQNLMTEITRVDKEADDEVDLYFKSITKIVKDQKLTSLQFLQIQGKLTLALKTELENMQ